MIENPIYKMVIVDDDDCVRKLTAAICATAASKAGMTPEIHEFNDGKPAREYLTHYTPHLIVTDYHMPELNGFDLLFGAKQLYKGISAILMSGGNSKESAESVAARAKALGVDFLQKPLSDLKLLEDLVIKYAPK